MKLKDIVPYCLDSFKYSSKYYWVINGLTYTIDSLERYSPVQSLQDHYDDPYPSLFRNDNEVCDYISLSRYSFINPNETKKSYDSEDNYLSLNLNHEITIFKNFIMVHKTDHTTNNDENNIFERMNYFVANGHECNAHHYTIGLFATDPLGGIATNLRDLFKDLINPPVQPKPADLTLDEKLDDLIDELMKNSRTTAVKKLKRMLNDRL
jgi:hypothetical protein